MLTLLTQATMLHTDLLLASSSSSTTPLYYMDLRERQRTVETSTFGSEMIAAQITIDLIMEF